MLVFWKEKLCSWIRRQYCKDTDYPQNVQQIQCSDLMSKSQAFLKKFDMMILKLKWKCKGSRITQYICKRRTKFEDFHYLILRSYYKATVVKISLCWHKNRYIDQWNRIENPEVDQQIHGQLIFNQDIYSIC